MTRPLSARYLVEGLYKDCREFHNAESSFARGHRTNCRRPSDAAFARLPDGVVDSLLATPAALADIVGYHVVPARLSAAEVARRVSAETFQGEDLTISSNGEVRVDGAHVVQGDIDASNGVIHVIDRVLLPARI